jgi:hypothetical protein
MQQQGWQAIMQNISGERDALRAEQVQVVAQLDAANKILAEVRVAQASADSVASSASGSAMQMELHQARQAQRQAEMQAQTFQDSIVLLQSRTISAEQERDYLRARYVDQEQPELAVFQQQLQSNTHARAQLSAEYESRLQQVTDEARSLERRLDEAEGTRDALAQQVRDLQTAMKADQPSGLGVDHTTGPEDTTQLQLEAQRRRYETELQKRARALLATQTRMRQLEQECDRLKFSLTGWAADKQTMEVLTHRLTDAVQQQRDMATRHAQELLRNQTTTKEAMGLLVQAQMQRDRAQRRCDDLLAAAAAAAASATSTATAQDGSVVISSVPVTSTAASSAVTVEELTSRLKDTESQRDAFRKQADESQRAAMAGQHAALQLESCQADLAYKDQQIAHLQRKVDELTVTRSAHVHTLEAQIQSKNRIVEDLRRRLEQSLAAVQLTTANAVAANATVSPPPLSASDLVRALELSPARVRLTSQLSAAASTSAASTFPMAAAVMATKSPTALRASGVHATAMATLPNFAAALTLAASAPQASVSDASSGAPLASALLPLPPPPPPPPGLVPGPVAAAEGGDDLTTPLQRKLASSKVALQTQLDSSKQKLKAIEIRARAGLEESKKRLEALERELISP